MRGKEGRSTPIGVLVTDVRDDGHVAATMRAGEGLDIVHMVTASGDEVTIEFWATKRLPRRGDEVTVGGSSVEVTRVETMEDGAVWVHGDNGSKARWS